jgi:hypothetical protein
VPEIALQHSTTTVLTLGLEPSAWTHSLAMWHIATEDMWTTWQHDGKMKLMESASWNCQEKHCTNKFSKKWFWQESNPKLLDSQTCMLTTELSGLRWQKCDCNNIYSVKSVESDRTMHITQPPWALDPTRTKILPKSENIRNVSKIMNLIRKMLRVVTLP